MSSTGTLCLLLGDQLDTSYPASLELDRDHDVILMVEVKQASLEPLSHVQRTVLFLSAMRHHARVLEDDGWTVRYVELTDDDNTHDFESELSRAIEELDPERVACIEPGSFSVRAAIENACATADVELRLEPDPHFLCSLEDFESWAKGRKALTMEYFYREQRRSLGVLVDDDGNPEGDTWNFDKENRESFSAEPTSPPPPTFDPDDITDAVMRGVAAELPDLPGSIDAFNWPVTRDQALECLRSFIDHRLPDFGTYQDAMWTGEHTLYHSLLSPMLNLKLLNPREVCQAAIDAYEDDAAPLNSVEGFIRQIIGWREFIRGVYYHESEAYASRNALEHQGELPEFYWTGETDMNCMKHALTSVLEHAYGHHIARLMITGNFAMLAGVSPQAVNDWYLGMYADGVEWVTTPNTIGMALHADGGVVGTKPYAASGNYIRRMSNYCSSCRYDVRARTGGDACPFNTLYWDFLMRHEDRFSKNNRMSLMLRNLEKIDTDERTQITVHATDIRKAIGVGEIG